MQLYTVFHKPETDDTQFVKEGFSWLALGLPFIWALYHRMFGAFVSIALFYGVTQYGHVAGYYPESIAALLQVALHVFLGLSASDLLGESLALRGYDYKGVVIGRDMLDGQQRYFDTQAA